MATGYGSAIGRFYVFDFKAVKNKEIFNWPPMRYLLLRTIAHNQTILAPLRGIATLPPNRKYYLFLNIRFFEIKKLSLGSSLKWTEALEVNHQRTNRDLFPAMNVLENEKTLAICLIRLLIILTSLNISKTNWRFCSKANWKYFIQKRSIDFSVRKCRKKRRARCSRNRNKQVRLMLFGVSQTRNHKSSCS